MCELFHVLKSSCTYLIVRLGIKQLASVVGLIAVTTVMNRIFTLKNPAPLSVRMHSRECCTYMNRVEKFVGWLPPKRGLRRYAYLLWTCLIFVIPSIYLPIGFGLSLLVDIKSMTPGEFLSLLGVFLNVIGLTVKSMIVLFHLDRMKQTESLLDVMDQRLFSDTDRLKIHKAIAFCNTVILIFGQLYLSYTLTVFMAGVVNGQPPWFIYNPLFDWKDSYGYFLMQAILEYLLIFAMATMELILDTFSVIFVYIFRAHLAVLKDHIRNLRSDPYKTEAENYDELVGCITYHKLILKCCNLMRPVMSPIIFVQFLLIGIVLGVTMINIMYFLDIYKGIASIFYLTGVMVESFPFCYLCDLLLEDCNEVSNLIGQSNWVDAERRYKTTLMIFLQHVQQPIIFMAFGVLPISLMTNIQVAKIAFSVMTVVQQMNLPDRFK